MPLVTNHTALLSGSSWGGIEVTGQPIFVTCSFLGASPASHADAGAMGAAASTFQAFDGRTACGPAPGALGAEHFVAHGSMLATAAAGTAQFIYHTGTGTLLFDADGLGGAAAARIAVLSAQPALGAADIILV